MTVSLLIWVNAKQTKGDRIEKKRKERILRAHYQRTLTVLFFYIVTNELHSFPFVMKPAAVTRHIFHYITVLLHVSLRWFLPNFFLGIIHHFLYKILPLILLFPKLVPHLWILFTLKLAVFEKTMRIFRLSQAVEKEKLSWCQHTIFSETVVVRTQTLNCLQKRWKEKSQTLDIILQRKNKWINKFMTLQRCGAVTGWLILLFRVSKCSYAVFHITADWVLLAHHDCYLYWKASKPLICMRFDVTFCILANSSWLLQKGRQCFIGTTAISPSSVPWSSSYGTVH